MTTKALVKASLYVVVAALAVNAARLATSHMRAQSVAVVPPGVTVTPYTATLTETVVARNGRRLNAPVQVLALRSDGEMLMQLGDGPAAVRHVRFASGVSAQVSDKLRARSTTRKAIEDSWIRDPRTNCARSMSGRPASQDESTPTIEQMAGYRAARISSDDRKTTS